MPAILTVYRWELRKLFAQRLANLALAAAAMAPVVYVVTLSVFQKGRPEADRPFARYVLDTGLAIPLFMLGWGLLWFLPALTAVVSGDLFATEEQRGTLKMVLTRSVSRGHVFGGKVLAAATHSVLTLALVALVAAPAGAIRFGADPLLSLSGNPLGVGRALALTAAGFALTAVPMLAFAAIALFFSVLTRHGLAAVAATMATLPLMAGLGLLFGGGSNLRDYLLLTHFGVWRALFHEPIYWQMIVTAVLVSAAYAVPALAGAYVIFRRRDVTSG